MYILSTFIFFFTLVVWGSATPYTDCGSQSGKVVSVEVSNCPDGQDVCVLKRGTKPTITINFESQSESKQLKAVVHGVIGNVPLPFSVPQPDACKCGVSCPVKNGEKYKYINDFNVRNSYPSVSVGVRYELTDDKGSDMICVQIPCEIK